jgi:gliding motility-associated-like protein
MKKLFLILLTISQCATYAQCDVDILEVDHVNGVVTVYVENSEGCAAGQIDMIMLGYHALDENCESMDVQWDVPNSVCEMAESQNHAGWTWQFSASTYGNNYGSDYMPMVTGDTVQLPMYNPYESDCFDGGFDDVSMGCCAEQYIDYWISLGHSVEVVIWQINWSSTWYYADGGWATTGANGDGTQGGSAPSYPDQEDENRWVIGPCGECVPEVVYDTVYQTLPPDTIEYYFTDTVVLTDTLVIDVWYYTTDTVEVYISDTIYQTEYVLDTVYVDQYVYDTTYVDQYVYDTAYVYLSDTVYIPELLYDTTYIFQLDTVNEYIVQEIFINCVTGDPCEENPEFDGCDEVSVFVPNVFTPNNDGLNDVFYAQHFGPMCWNSWKLSVYNRWGGMVFQTNDSTQSWDGSVMGGSHYAADGIYVWVLQARSSSGKSIDIKGTVQLFR